MRTATTPCTPRTSAAGRSTPPAAHPLLSPTQPPTPEKKNPQLGLVKSQQAELATLADGFKKYLEYDPDAKLSVEAHADDRGSHASNPDMSAGRVAPIAVYLASQAI